MLLTSKVKIKKGQESTNIDYKIEFYFFHVNQALEEAMINRYLALFFLNFFRHQSKLMFHKYEFFKGEESTSGVYLYIATEEPITKTEKNELCEKLGQQLDQLFEQLYFDQQLEKRLAVLVAEQTRQFESLSQRFDKWEQTQTNQQNLVMDPKLLSAINENQQLLKQLVNQLDSSQEGNALNEQPLPEIISVSQLVESQPEILVSNNQEQVEAKEQQFKKEIVRNISYIKSELTAIFDLFTQEERVETIKNMKNLFIEIDAPIDQLNYCLFYWQSISRYNLSISTCKIGIGDTLEFLEKKLMDLPQFLQEIESNSWKLSPKNLQFDVQQKIVGYAKLNQLMSRYYRESFDEHIDS